MSSHALRENIEELHEHYITIFQPSSRGREEERVAKNILKIMKMIQNKLHGLILRGGKWLTYDFVKERHRFTH